MKKISPNTYVISGSIEIEELTEKFDEIKLPLEPDKDTPDTSIYRIRISFQRKFDARLPMSALQPKNIQHIVLSRRLTLTP